MAICCYPAAMADQPHIHFPGEVSPQPAPLPCFLLSGLYGLGLLFSFYLFWLYFSTGSTSLCALFHSDCIGVELSEYGSVAGFPVASLGLAYFTLQLVLTLASCRHKQAAAWRLSLLGNTAAAGGSLYFIFIMTSVLHESCIVCYGVHLLNLCSLWVHIRGCRRNKNTLAPGASSCTAFMPAAYAASKTAVLLALLVFVSANLFLSRQQLAQERLKSSENLSYQRYLHQTAVAHEFAVEPKDQVLGKPKALHQIVLIYKSSCRFCKIAKKQLSEAVEQYPAAVFLIMKNYEDIPAARLKELEVEHVPAVFIDGRRAQGWDAPGFLEQFTKDCGC